MSTGPSFRPNETYRAACSLSINNAKKSEVYKGRCAAETAKFGKNKEAGPMLKLRHCEPLQGRSNPVLIILSSADKLR